MTDTKAQIRALVDEFTNALGLGEEPQYARPLEFIARELDALGNTPEGRKAGYYRPYSTHEVWRAFDANGVSEWESERRRLIACGLATATPADLEREQKRAESMERTRREDEERLRQRREADRDEAAIITRKSVGLTV